ncbi:hypothetical protein DM02DRAFT_695367 [Periconia macrospinosa]|uniref:Metalloproteases (Zincins), catalytic n=1 Tax=Periconia macrospinosa TaxID=97972 RepID=A0A2V1D6F0_9PLEO|nr:hypothetical protein DM02DRAFT_695367 [Periconia macrospinosa]
MRFSRSLQFLLSFSTLAAGFVVPREDTFDPDNPEASNPKTPPKRLNRSTRPENPFKKAGLKTAPDSCTDLAQPGGVNAFSGGELKWDKDYQCDPDTQQARFLEAAWDAHALAKFSNKEPDGHNAKDIAMWKTAAEFETKKTFDIILSCKDTKNWCQIKVDGQALGGYAWTYDGWFGYKYYYITMCEPFFRSDDLEYKITQIEEELAKGETEKASTAEWQRNTGQMFLHEMMHLNSTGQPHIEDVYVDPDASGKKAYGPALVHKLARRKLNQGGGASRASINGESYAWLTNSRYFYELTGYFLIRKGYKQSDESLSAEQVTEEQTGFTLDLGRITETTSNEEITNRFNGILAGLSNKPTSSGPSKGKAMSIAMVATVNSHAGGATVNSEWHFFTTSVGKAVGSCGETDGQQLIPTGGSNVHISGKPDSENPPWPAGIYNLNIEGKDCEYKCDGTNPGRLFCGDKQIPCTEDSMKSKPEGKLKCGSRTSLHAVVYCDF